jgi:anti-sigma regulatory factor (Ser/Thr protein kinase)
MRFPMAIESVGRARQFVRSSFRRFPPATVDTAELLTSELATNAVLHGRTAFDVVVSESDDRLRVAVIDRSGRMPVLLSPAESDVHGRGLLILDELSDHWGTEENPTGKVVWFDLAAGARHAAPRS